MRHRHRYRRGRAGDRHPVLTQPPQIIGNLGGSRAESAQIVEPEHRVRVAQLHLGIQIAQQPITEWLGQGAQLLLGVLDQRPQRRLTGHHLVPGQPADAQRHRIFSGEPPHRAGQVHIGSQLLMPPMTLHGDADRRRPRRRKTPRPPTRTRSTKCRAPRHETPPAPRPAASGWCRSSSATDNRPAAANVSTPADTPGNTVGVAATWRHASA